MEKKALHNLLERYYNGETDIREEMMLYHHFASKERNEPDYETDKLLMMLTQSLKEKQHATLDIEGNLSAYIDKQLTHSFVNRLRSTINRYAVAAAIAVLVGMTAMLFYLHYANKPADTYSDPYLAYQEAKKTLLFVSEKLNTGMEPLSNIDKINTGTEALKSFEAIEKNLEMVGFFTFVNQTSSLK